MRNPIISVPSVSGFMFGLVVLPLLKILALLLVCKIILAGGLYYYMAGITVLAVACLVFVFFDLRKKNVPQKLSENEKKFLNGFILGIIMLFVFLILSITDTLNALGLKLADLF
jgi:hypothetical protein